MYVAPFSPPPTTIRVRRLSSLNQCAEFYYFEWVVVKLQVMWVSIPNMGPFGIDDPTRMQDCNQYGAEFCSTLEINLNPFNEHVGFSFWKQHLLEHSFY